MLLTKRFGDILDVDLSLGRNTVLACISLFEARECVDRSAPQAMFALHDSVVDYLLVTVQEGVAS